MARTSLVLATLLAASLPAQELPEGWLVIGRTGRSGRSPVHTDAIEARLVRGELATPEEGAEVVLPDGSRVAWQAARSDNGTVRAPRGGYAFCVVDAEEAVTRMLAVRGHSMVYVNGEPRGGNPYGYGWFEVPVRLRKGSNELLFRCGRGPIRPALRVPPRDLYVLRADWTVPDLIAGEDPEVWIGVPVVNASTEARTGISIVTDGDGFERTYTGIGWLPPLSVRKVAARVKLRAALSQPGRLELGVTFSPGPDADHHSIELAVKKPAERHRRTYLSQVDGSAQYYAINPAQPAGEDAPPPAVVLTCHGASVKASGQAGAYSDKSWAHVVAPTNRRPYGFDWEDWGRRDAIEVLDYFRRDYRHDPQRIYLTGHSMGGHGTWHLGATFPSLWAAIGPSAGWISFFSYSRGRRFENPSPMQELLLRASSSSDTLLLKHNFAQHGVYVLHGDKDRNVPVREARRMKSVLDEFHRDFAYHEQPGAGHWWDDGDEPGAGCVDWQPMFDFFARRRIPRTEEVRFVDFTTVNPGVSAGSHWVTIHAQRKQHAPSRVRLRWDPGRRRFAGTTDNVARLSLFTAMQRGGPVRVQLDGDDLAVPNVVAGRGLMLERVPDGWREASNDDHLKNPKRYGPFKQVFQNRFVCVAGTGGSAQEREWAVARARFDVETFWYRGNGNADVIPDTAFSPEEFRGRNVVLYGNAATNAAWKALLSGSPAQVEPGRVRVGDRAVDGKDLACLFIRPRKGHDRALVGVVGGTGITGMRLTDRASYWVSGSHYPDLFCWGPEMLSKDTAGVKVAGFFGLDWGVESGEFIWQ